jgi:myo-inositol catabolism protein IolS
MIESIPAGMGLGGWAFGDMGGGPSDATASIALIRDAFQLGIRHLDTAADYGNGRSEEVIGAAIAPFSGDVFVSSKAHATSREETPRIVQGVLRRLGRTWLDLFYIHWPKTGLDLRPMMEALETLRTQGQIRFIGVSNFGVKEMENASQGGRIDAHQLCYNLLWRYPEKEVIPWCRARGVPGHPVGPRKGGHPFLPGRGAVTRAAGEERRRGRGTQYAGGRRRAHAAVRRSNAAYPRRGKYI